MLYFTLDSNRDNPVSRDSQGRIPLPGPNDPLSYFSPDYRTARERFRRAAENTGAALHTLPIDTTGPDESALSIDIAWIGSEKPRRALIHTSGIHGVEGFTGSAIQLGILESVPSPPEDGAMILVHAMNPYGMAWLRRANEHNVDLNRNFLAAGEPYAGAPAPYRELCNLLNPATPPCRDLFAFKALLAILRHGYAGLVQAVAGGQYDYPQGLFYGGDRLQPGPRLYRDWLQQHLPAVQKLLVVDVHTGLGKPGQESLLHSMAATSSKKLEERLARNIIPNHAGAGIPDYSVRGGHQQLYRQLYPEAAVDFITEEFGTRPALAVLATLRDENRHYHHGTDDNCHRFGRRLKAAFCPPSEKWRRSVLSAGVGLARRAAASLFASG